MREIWTLSCLAAVLVTAFGCSNVKDAPVVPQDTDSDDKLGIGDDCTGVGECDTGLVCSGIDGTCQPEGEEGTTGQGGPCTANWECQWGMVCAGDGTCQYVGSSGTTEAGGNCEDDSDCQMFLQCLDGVCQGYQPPYWSGISCEDPVPTNDPVKIYFEIGDESGEFYRLPYPNNARVSGGQVDLSAHPSPGVLIEELGDPVGDYFTVVEEDTGGVFGPLSCVYFRFNRWPDFGTIENMEDIYIMNIDPASDNYGVKAWSGYRGTSIRGNYICHNWFALCPSSGRPMAANTTFAAIITTNVGGVSIEQDEAFQSMLAAAPPGEPTADHAWNAYQPLRDYIEDQSLNGGDIAAASVFTTGTQIDTIPKVREAVVAEAAPVVTDLQTDSTDPEFTLYTGQVSIPFYQAGTRPFKTTADGGAVEWDTDGLPLWVEDEDVSFALTVPSGTAPVEGWPVVLYAHGTGGSAMSFVDNEVASIAAGEGAAVIGVEQVMHGERRGLTGSQADMDANSPQRLFLSYRNLRAKRDHNVQAAADHFQLVRLVLDFAAITGEPVVFDPEKVYFFGDTQGTQGPLLFAAHEPAVKGVILSSAGGHVIESMAAQQNPIDVATQTKLMLTEIEVDRYHPVLNIVQTAFDTVDPLNHAQVVFRLNFSDQGYPRRHTFMSYGVGDTYTPEPAQIALAKNLWVKQWPIEGYEIPTVEQIDSLPHSSSYTYDGGVTAVVVQYLPDGDYDAQLVMFQHPDALSQWPAFLGSMITDGIPTLYAP
jgi:hypothetical protein